MFTAEEQSAIYNALSIIQSKFTAEPISVSSPTEVKQFLTLAYAGEEREVFSVLWLNSQTQLIECERLSLGTINQASVYPREVVKSAMRRNAAACVFAHNHPSGACYPSTADLQLTRFLRDALNLVDVRVLDHVIVANASTYSFAEHGDM